jgi:hypothetical protein
MSCTKESGSNPALVGAWKSRVEFQSGSLGSIKDLEFMYAFNAGGTMTESSNYDAAPPVPPAYGVWSPMGSNLYEARYEFYVTRQPTPDEAAAASSGWLPAGYGVLNEIITLSEDGTSFTSAIRYELFDQGDKPVAGGGSGTGHGVRLRLK